MPHSDQSTLFSLQIGRALAALAVMVHHANIATRNVFPEMPMDYYWLFNLGYLGIDYFFVLSGFIIAHATYGMKTDMTAARSYFCARFIRIYVPYLPVCLAMIAALTLVPDLTAGRHGDFSWFSSLLLPLRSPTALPVAWTLQLEVIFYVLFGICFFVLKKPGLIFVWAPLIVVAPYLEMPRWAYLILSPLNLEFLLGIAAYYLYRRKALFRWRYGLVVGGALLILLVTHSLLDGKAFYYYHLWVGAGFACIVLGLVYMESRADFSRYRKLIFLGGASYSLYLVHGPFLSVVWRVGHGITYWQIALPLFSILALSAGLAYFWLIEKPLMTRAKKYCVSANRA